MSPLGTPLVAIENGVLTNLNWHYAGGIGITVVGDSGDSWYYAHLNGYAPGIVAGMRVAAGTYKPSVSLDGSSDARTVAFSLKSEVALYGGFAGVETTLDQRDVSNRITTLSGDLGQSDDITVFETVRPAIVLYQFTIQERTVHRP